MTLDEAIDALVNEFSIGDYIYAVREHSGADEEWRKANLGVSSWEHPSVKRYSDVVSVLTEHAKRKK